VELDFQAMKEDAVLLMDSYFNVIVWYGEFIKGWKDQKLNEDPEYAYLTNLFESPLRDAGQIMYDRIPISNYYETFKNDGKERYLKARVNPSNSGQAETDGHLISDDAPISTFMKFLISSVINHVE
jgi:protein transport protein SEC23